MTKIVVEKNESVTTFNFEYSRRLDFAQYVFAQHLVYSFIQWQCRIDRQSRLSSLTIQGSSDRVTHLDDLGNENNRNGS